MGFRSAACGVLAVLLFLTAYCGAQEPARQKPQPGMGGIASAGSFNPVYDAEKRPITAGGFVDKGTIVFEDITKAVGLASWRHVMGTRQKKYILETDGSGVTLLDYDNDGWLDIYLVNGFTYKALEGKETAPHAALFHNNHDGTFTDVAARADVTNDRWGLGVAIGDWPWRRSGRRNSRDSLAFRFQGGCKNSGSRSFLHHYRRRGNNWSNICKQELLRRTRDGPQWIAILEPSIIRH